MRNSEFFSEDAKEEKSNIWKKAQIIINVIGVIAIPIILIVVNNSITSAIKEREVQTKYVELAINILRDSPTPERIALRTWAFEVMTRFSPFQMDDNLKKQLINSIPIFIGLGETKIKAFTAAGNPILNINGKPEKPKE